MNRIISSKIIRFPKCINCSNFIKYEPNIEYIDDIGRCKLYNSLSIKEIRNDKTKCGIFGKYFTKLESFLLK